MLDEIVKIVEHKKIFKRNKKDIETKILAVFLYHRALSYRDASKILGIIEPASYEAVDIGTINSSNCLLFYVKSDELLQWMKLR